MSVEDNVVNKAGNEDDWEILLKSQPENFHGLNVLDLGLFNSLQSLQNETASKTISELTHSVKVSYINLLKENITRTF